jgi:hypothetical protein
LTALRIAAPCGAALGYVAAKRRRPVGRRNVWPWQPRSGRKSARSRPRPVTVGSKWGYTHTADWRADGEVHEVKEHSAAVLKHQWRESSSHLGEYLKVYQIHSATFDSSVLDNREVLDELARLKRGGIVIGPTLSVANQAEILARARTIDRDGEPLFGCVQATWTCSNLPLGPLWPRPGPPAWA